ADCQGGGIYNEGGTVKVLAGPTHPGGDNVSSEADANTAGMSGGGIYGGGAGGTATLGVSGSRIGGNIVNVCNTNIGQGVPGVGGGGIYTDGTATIDSSGLIDQNTALCGDG